MTVSLRAIGIVRVSQRDDDAVSPEVQARALLRQATAEGLSLAQDDIWDENITSDGKVRPASGGAALAERPKLLAAVEAVERGEASVIIAERFDRLFRDLPVQHEVIRRVEAAGGRLVTAAGQISHATAESELHANLNGSIAQYMKRTATERSRAAVQIAIDEGRVPWRNVTPGYTRAADGRFVVGELAPVVRTAFWLRAQDRITLANVQTYLRANGLPTITLRHVQTLLKSRVVRGEVHFGSYRPNLAAHEPIVTEDEWQRAQGAREPRGRRAKSDRLLARQGVLRCGSCGGPMVINTLKRQYKCSGMNEGCPRRVAINADAVDAAVRDVVQAAYAGIVGSASADSDAVAAVAELQRAQGELDAAIRTLAVVGDEPAAIERLAALRAARDEAQARANRLRGQVDARTIDVGDWERLTLSTRRRAVKAHIDAVFVAPGSGGADRLDFRISS
jgi:DNA invertase Pin-like site-specific DNA recombinase